MIDGFVKEFLAACNQSKIEGKVEIDRQKLTLKYCGKTKTLDYSKPYNIAFANKETDILWSVCDAE